jgi:subtilisin family serine protease
VNLQGETQSAGSSLLPENDVISWSSAGPTLDGRQKPDVLAPGFNIISAMSSRLTYAYTVDNGAKFGYKLIESWQENNLRVNMLTDCGTSMATPVATGVIALWLQADPTLTPAKIKEVLAATSKHINQKVTYPNNIYGHGEIAAYDGLLNILKINTAIPDLPRQLVQVTLQGRTLHIEGCDNAQVTIYSLNGQQVFSGPATDGTIQLPVLSSGVYAVKVGHQGSTLIRL